MLIGASDCFNDQVVALLYGERIRNFTTTINVYSIAQVGGMSINAFRKLLIEADKQQARKINRVVKGRIGKYDAVLV